MQVYSSTENIFNNVDVKFLVTEMKDNDKIVRAIANQTKKEKPCLFEGESPYVYYKMKYVQPFDEFKELKKLILRVKESTGLRSDFKGIVAVDLFDWINHENDEYFDITFKFLYDYRHIYKYIFTFRDSNIEKLRPMFNKSINYFRIKVIDKCLFNHKDELKKYIKIGFDRCDVQYDISVIDKLVDIFSDNNTKNIKSYEKIDMILQDISDNFPNIKITIKTLINSLSENKLILQ